MEDHERVPRREEESKIGRRVLSALLTMREITSEVLGLKRVSPPSNGCGVRWQGPCPTSRCVLSLEKPSCETFRQACERLGVKHWRRCTSASLRVRSALFV